MTQIDKDRLSILNDEWDKEKNSDVEFKDISLGSSKKAWWICSKGHNYSAIISNRTKKNGTGCPYCAGKKVCDDNCLENLNPELAKEWHHEKNKDLKPKDVTVGSSKKVWWKCDKAHTFEATIKSRCNNNRGCPYCSGKLVCIDNCLETVNPSIAKEWHPVKNESLTPSDITSGSNKKIWWKCNQGHEYRARVYNRTKKNGSGCPYCAGKLICEDNCLRTTHPELAEEWHTDKNKTISPDTVTKGSQRLVWWLCPQGHEYKSNILNRTYGAGCPYCANKIAHEGNSLGSLFPHIAKEWHSTKNNGVTPYDVTKGSRKKYWWLCPKGHEYVARPLGRTTGGTNCPYCSNQTSRPEIRVLTELKSIFKKVESRVKIAGKEVDIFLPDHSIGIEYDGAYFHKENRKSDINKNKIMKENKVFLLRLREKPLKKISLDDVIIEKNLDKKSINDLLKKVKVKVNNTDELQSIERYLGRASFENEKEYKDYLNKYASCSPGRSLITKHPNLAHEWDYHKNFPLIPDSFSYGSNDIVWWLCKNNHSFNMSILHRTSGGSCPYCQGRKVCIDNCLNTVRPDIAKQWHPILNKKLTPYDVTRGSKKRVWWLCPKGHEFKAQINSRTRIKGGTSCPYCAGKKVCIDNSLLTLKPELAKQWHDKKNTLAPSEVTVSSSKKVWWRCEKGHEFQAVISNKVRLGEKSCPYCAGKKSCLENNIQVLHPNIASDWDYKKNSSTPSMFVPGSHKKVWWLCSNGHEYKKEIRQKVKSPKCPHCSSKDS